MRTQWTDENLESAIRPICSSIGRFPTVAELREMGRNDLACVISKRGGFIAWANRLGVARAHSDSDTGWEGESLAAELLKSWGFACERQLVKAPFDILLDGVLRVDVKSARLTSYGVCTGWFYRIGKTLQADVLMLVQLDTRDCYLMPWYIVPKTNITISRNGGKYAKWLNAYDWLSSLRDARSCESSAASA